VTPIDVAADAHTEPEARCAEVTPTADPPVQVIMRRPGWQPINFRELWRYRELLFFLTWRDVKVRYKQTVLGIAWVVLQPVLTMLVFTVFFGRLAGLEQRTGGLPYPLFVYTGLLLWTLFASAITNAGNSLVINQHLITKTYFPRLVIPLSCVGVALVDFAVAFMVLIGMMLWYGVAAGAEMLLLPVVVVLTVLMSLGVGAALAGLTVAYRDFRYVVPFIAQLWMFLTPVMYPSEIVPERWRWLLALNPMAGLVDAWRYAVLGWLPGWNPGALLASAAVTVAVCGLGLFYFRQVERHFADIV
jgi:lipopolysaccharide transport system permease protein